MQSLVLVTFLFFGCWRWLPGIFSIWPHFFVFSVCLHEVILEALLHFVDCDISCPQYLKSFFDGFSNLGIHLLYYVGQVVYDYLG